ncbi:protein of unknown function [Pseudomonas mediterranea]
MVEMNFVWERVYTVFLHVRAPVARGFIPAGLRSVPQS